MSAERRRLVGASGPALVGLLVLTAAVLLYAGRGGGLYYDDWNFVLERLDWTPGEFLAPHNEHLSIVPVTVYKVVFATVGADQYWILRLALVLVHCSTIAAMFVYARPRVGGWLALALVAPVALYGAAYIDLLWAFQLGYAASLLTGVLAFVALDRGSRRGDLVACAMVCASLGSSSVGLCVLAAVAVEVAATRARRSWFVVVVPVALYAAWWLVYHAESTGFKPENVLAIPSYVSNGLGAVLATLAGYQAAWGPAIAVVLVLVLFPRVREMRTVPWRLVALALVPFTFWALAAIARADLVGPETPRYLYPPAVFVVLVVCEVLRGYRIPRAGLVAVLVLAGLAVLSNLAGLRAGGRELANFRLNVYGSAGALELAGERMDPGFAPTALSPQILAGTFVRARDRLGPIVGGEAGVRANANAGRDQTDAALQVGLKLGFQPAGAASPRSAPEVASTENAQVAPEGECLRGTPSTGTGALSITLPPNGVIVSGDASSSAILRRYGDAFVQPPLAVGSADPMILRAPADAGRTPYRARLSFGAPVRVCAAGSR